LAKSLGRILTNLYQRVSINHTFCENKVFNPGIPQGTVLEPLFLIIHIHGSVLNNLYEDSILLCYADDIIILISDLETGGQ